MSDAALKLLEQVKELDPADQAEFSCQFFDMLPEVDDETEAEATAQWKAELDRRLAAVADGSAQSLPLAEAMAEARAELAKRMEKR